MPEASRERHAVLRAQYWAAPARRRMARDCELVGRKQDGTEVSVDLTLSPLTRGSSLFVNCFVSDISAGGRRRGKSMATRRTRAVGRVTSSAGRCFGSVLGGGRQGGDEASARAHGDRQGLVARDARRARGERIVVGAIGDDGGCIGACAEP